MIKYIHVRDLDVNDRPLPTGGITVAYDSQFGVKDVMYAYARCSPKDHYKRKQGAVKATGRMKSPRYVHTFTLEGNDPVVVQVLNHVFQDIANDVKQAAENRCHVHKTT